MSRKMKSTERHKIESGELNIKHSENLIMFKKNINETHGERNKQKD